MANLVNTYEYVGKGSYAALCDLHLEMHPQVQDELAGRGSQRRVRVRLPTAKNTVYQCGMYSQFLSRVAQQEFAKRRSERLRNYRVALREGQQLGLVPMDAPVRARPCAMPTQRRSCWGTSGRGSSRSTSKRTSGWGTSALCRRSHGASGRPSVSRPP